MTIPALCHDGLASTSHTLDAAGMRWHYLRWRAGGPQLVLWHGVTSDAHGWWRVGPYLAGRGYDVFAVDLPGHGMTEDAPGGYAVEHTARLLDAWLQASGVEAPIVIGHSWGGLNALQHATDGACGVRPRALVLEDPALLMPADPAPYLPFYTGDLDLRPDSDGFAQLRATNPRWHECDIRWKLQALERVRRRAVESFFWHNAGADLVPRLGAVSVPALLLLADPAFGGIWARQHVAIAEQACAEAIRVETIAGSSHNVHRDSFEPFVDALDRFLRELPA